MLPAGSFRMGATQAETSLDPYWSLHQVDEWPIRNITIPYPFAVSRFAITVAEFRAFAKSTKFKTADGAHTFENNEWLFRKGRSWESPGFEQTLDHPVVCISWLEAKMYADWLREATNQPYRLLSEAEWEYACRAGTDTPFWWGSDISPALANYDARYVYGNSLPGQGRAQTVRVHEFQPNAWGLYQMHGNVAEWCEDNWANPFFDDLRVFRRQQSEDEHCCSTEPTARPFKGHIHYRYVLRGGSWRNSPGRLRSSCRGRANGGRHNSSMGFRVARDLDNGSKCLF